MKTRVITISREFGSGGRTVGKQTAKLLGIPCYDQEVIEKVAAESGFAKEYIKERGEYTPYGGWFAQALTGRSARGTSPQDDLWVIQRKVILELAEKPCVIVGRCSDYVLGERPECLKVFVYADLPSRIARCVEDYHIPSDDMERRIIQMDRGRSNYYNYYTGHNWGDMRRYDLTLNSSTTGIEGAVELISTLVKARAALDTL